MKIKNFIDSGAFREVFDLGDGWVIKYAKPNGDSDEEYDEEYAGCSYSSWLDCPSDGGIESNENEMYLYAQFKNKMNCLCPIDLHKSNNENIYMKKITPFLDIFNMDSHYNYDDNRNLLNITYTFSKNDSDDITFDLKNYNILDILTKLGELELLSLDNIKQFCNEVNELETLGYDILQDLSFRNIGLDGSELKILDYGIY